MRDGLVSRHVHITFFETVHMAPYPKMKKFKASMYKHFYDPFM